MSLWKNQFNFKITSLKNELDLKLPNSAAIKFLQIVLSNDNGVLNLKRVKMRKGHNNKDFDFQFSLEFIVNISSLSSLDLMGEK